MPQTYFKSNPSLGIRLESPSYAPGDTIVGCVFRKSPTVSPNSSVTISLSGKAKAKMVVGDGNRSETYRGRFNLIARHVHSQTVFQGPLHIEGGGDEQVWPFAITLPKYVDPRYVNDGTEDQCSLLPPGKTDHELPPSCKLLCFGSSEAFVEYVLEASLRLTGHNYDEAAEATLPFNITSFYPNPPIANFAIKRWRCCRSVSSYRLVPGMEDVKLSFSQKLKQNLSFSSIPDFKFDLFVDVPTSIQLDNPAPIPFRLRVVPDWAKTSEIIQGVPQTIRLTGASFRIVTVTGMFCGGTFTPQFKEKSTEVDLNIIEAINELHHNIYIPCTNEWPSIDIGKMINLRIGRLEPGFPQQQQTGHVQFTPDFTTHNLRVFHRLRWSVQGEVAGERFSAEGISPLDLLAPSDGRRVPDHITPPRDEMSEPVAGPSQVHRSESWIKPPEEEELPTYGQVQEERSRALV
ncbi:hypothetical protein FSARC_13993 [Fusarium sarcochroum]|uniref:Arrestin-like N-terminal domain-containing protein n=1 Tax=Fusarium sarcochroum TaxID=1208366 RepID=A0A8H4WR72_9HYPO|nr:hypothetical protein FSARC_13993 [Fusarium sarcochroum]